LVVAVHLGGAISIDTNSTGNVVGIFYSNAWYKCLDLKGGDTTNGNKLQLWDCNGMDNQKWIFDANMWKIVYAANTNKCIDVPGDDVNDGTRLWIWDCNGGDSQTWGYDSSEGTIYLAKSGRDASKCMDLTGGRTKNGNHVEVWDCNGMKNQQWSFSAPSPGPAPGPGPSPSPSGDPCLAHVNAIRAQHGAPPYELLGQNYQQCTAQEAEADSKSGKAHGSFPKCGEYAQGVAGGSCIKATDAFMSEWPCTNCHASGVISTKYHSFSYGQYKNHVTVNYYYCPEKPCDPPKATSLNVSASGFIERPSPHFFEVSV